MTLRKNRSLDGPIYTALVMLVAAAIFGTLLEGRFAVLSIDTLELLLGCLAYAAAFTRFDAWRETHPRFGTFIFFALQWILFVALLLKFQGNYLWLLSTAVVSQSVGTCSRVNASVVTSIFLFTLVWIFQEGHFTWSHTFSIILSTGAAYIFVFVFTIVTTRATQARKKSELLTAELESANSRLHEAAQQTAALAAANERNRIARDIHDGLGHSLTVIAVQLQVAKTLMDQDPTRARQAISRAEELSRQALNEVRDSVGTLRTLKPIALPDALNALIEQCGLPSDLDIKGTPRPLSEESTHTLFRVAQEGLTNVRKHAQASRVKVTLNYDLAEIVSISVEDDGRGEATSAHSGFGLRGLEERAAQLGGKMSAGRHAAGGYRLSVEIPA